MKRVAVWMMALMLLVSSASFLQGTAQAKPKAKASVTHQATGVITSVEPNKVVLSHKVKGKEEQTTYIMNTQTKREGDLKSGEKAIVHYRVENKENVVTSIKASVPTKAAARK